MFLTWMMDKITRAPEIEQPQLWFSVGFPFNKAISFVNFSWVMRFIQVIYPLLSLFSQLSGVAALFCWAFFKSPILSRSPAQLGDHAGSLW